MYISWRVYEPQRLGSPSESFAWSSGNPGQLKSVRSQFERLVIATILRKGGSTKPRSSAAEPWHETLAIGFTSPDSGITPSQS